MSDPRTPPQVTVKLTGWEADAVLEACEHFQESWLALTGVLNVHVARVMRKIAAELARGEVGR